MELLPEIPGGSVDLVICDLPYGTTECKWDHVLPMETLWRAELNSSRRHSLPAVALNIGRVCVFPAT